MHRCFFAVGFAMLVSAAPCRAERLDLFIGTWRIDYDATLKEARKSPKYRPEEDKLVRKILRRTADSMTLSVTDSELAFASGDKASVIAYEITSQKAGQAILAYKNSDSDATITLEIRGADMMNLRSSVTPDMDYYIWKRAKTRKE
jgi:hypothetical protein